MIDINAVGMSIGNKQHVGSDDELHRESEDSLHGGIMS